MSLRKFSEEVMTIISSIHLGIIKDQTNALTSGRISFPQMVVVEILRLKRECRMSDIATTLQVTKSAVTGMTDRLIKENIIKRKRLDSDRRVVKIALTPKGLKLAAQISDCKRKSIEKMFSGVTEKERKEYLRILRKIKDNLHLKHERKLDE